MIRRRRNWERWLVEEFIEFRDRLDVVEETLFDILERLFPPVSAQILLEGEQVASISVQVGAAAQTATVEFFDGPDGSGNQVPPQSVPVWSSSDPSVAAIDASADASGLAAALSYGNAGTATVTASSTNNDGTVVSASLDVTVEAPAPAAPVSATITVA